MAYNKTTWENLPSTNTPIIASNLNNIENELESLDTNNTFSTTEQRIGTWADGKPLYRKMLYISSLPNNTATNYSINIPNVDKYWVDKSNSIIMWPSGGCNAFDNLSTDAPKATSIGTLYPGAWIVLNTDYDNKAVRIGTGVDRRNLSAYVCIKYTKTTD